MSAVLTARPTLSDDTIELTVFGNQWLVRFDTLSDPEWPACWCTEVYMPDGEPYLMDKMFHPEARVAFNDALEAKLLKRRENWSAP